MYCACTASILNCIKIEEIVFKYLKTIKTSSVILKHHINILWDLVTYSANDLTVYCLITTHTINPSRIPRSQWAKSIFLWKKI